MRRAQRGASTPPGPPPGPRGTRVGVVQHADDCPPGLLGEWLTQAGATLDVRRPAAGDALPTVTECDAIVVLGGPMGAYDVDAAPWLAGTRQLVREAAAVGTPLLGVCLGHQLAAVALGGRVEVSAEGQQLGVLPIGWTPAAAADELVRGLAASRIGVFWNHDVVVDLPPGAELLARALDGRVQAARLAPTVWGVQWHPEVDGVVVATWAGEDRAAHEALGIDQVALLDSIDAARSELDAAWRPLASALLRLARATAGHSLHSSTAATPEDRRDTPVPRYPDHPAHPDPDHPATTP